jgi:hypothetical protein
MLAAVRKQRVAKFMRDRVPHPSAWTVGVGFDDKRTRAINDSPGIPDLITSDDRHSADPSELEGIKRRTVPAFVHSLHHGGARTLQQLSNRVLIAR